jgi:PAS domain S-box-containing protein
MNSQSKILVVDHDQTLLSATRQVLESAGYQTFQALSGEDVLSIVQEARPDLVLLDVNLDKLDGFEVCRRIKTDPSLVGTYLVILSKSYTDPDSRAQGLELGADDYLVRPIANRELLVRVRACLRAQAAERDLQASEKRFRALIENSSAAITLLDANGIAIYDSPAAPGMLGYAPVDWIGRDVFSLIHPEDLPRNRELFQELVKTPGACVNNIFRVQHKSGAWLWLEMVATNLLCEPGVNAIVLNYRDITRRKQAEDALRESEDKFKYLFDHSVLGKSITQIGGEINVNQAFCELLGYSAEELKNRKWQEISHPDDLELTQTEINTLLSGQRESTRFIKRFIHKNGSVIWVEMASALRRDADGKPLYFMTSIHDISARKQAEQAMQASNAYLQAVLDSVTDALFVDDAETGQIIDVNQGMCAMYGYSRAEALRTPIGALSQGEPPYSQAEALAWLQKAREIGPQTFEWRARRKDDQLFWAEVNIRFVVIDGQNRFVVVVRDISERKRAEEALRDAKDYSENLIKTANTMVVGMDLGGNITVFNQAAEAITGYARSELQNRNWFEVITPKDRYPQVWAIFEKLTGGGLPKYFENLILTKTGEERYIVWQNNVVFEKGRIAGTISFGMDITERKQAEEKLRESLALLRIAEETAKLGGWSVNLETNRVTWSDQTAAIHEAPAGFSPSLEDGLNFYAPEWREKITKVFGDCARSGISYNEELEIIIAGGKRVWVQTIGEAVRDEQGKIIKVHGAFQDITQRKRVEAALEESRRLFQSLIESLPQNIYAKDLSGRFIFANQRYCATQGKRLEEVIGKTDLDLHPSEFAEKYRRDDLRVCESGQTIDIEEEHQPLGGEKSYVEVIKAPLYDANGQPSGVLGIFWDITERKRAEEMLNTERNLLRTLIDNLPDRIYVKDMQGRKTLSNTADWQASGGKTLEEVIGKPDSAVYPPELAAQFGADDQAVMDSGNPIINREEPGLDIAGNPVWVLSTKVALRNMEGEILGMVGIGRDITERKLAEDEIRKLNAELEARVEARTRELHEAQEKLVRQEKLAVLGQLAGGVGHELRNPLGVINNALYFLRLIQPEADETVKEYLGIIETETHNADKIIGDLLDFSRIKSVDLEPVAVSGLIQRTLERFPAPKSVRVRLNLPRNLPAVYVDPRQMTQVLGNLVLNACQSMPAGGELTISARKKGKLVAISVRDTGVGITPENMKKLFEPLFTTKPKGIGLGLAVSKKLIEANGGQIEAESEAGVGTTFTLSLPASGEGERHE